MTSESLFDTEKYKEAMGQFATGVVAITGNEDGKLVGFAAQSFVSLSIDPPLVLFCPQKSSTSWPRIRAIGGYSINVLPDDHGEISEAFAVVGAVADVRWTAGRDSATPILLDSVAYIDCTFLEEHDAGDHTIVVSKVRDFKVNRPDVGPLIYLRGNYGYFRLLNHQPTGNTTSK